MQKDNPGTPKSRDAVKRHQASTSEDVLNRTTVDITPNICACTCGHRLTMLPSDFATPLREKFNLNLLKAKERDIIELIKAQKEIDSQIADANEHTKNRDIKNLESLSLPLGSLLEYLGTLHGNNICLPDTHEEWEEITEALKSCNDTMKSIKDLIGTKSESYQSSNNGLKDLLNTYDMEGNQKRMEKELCDLQVPVLEVSSSLMQGPD